MYSTSTGAAVEKAPEPDLEQHVYRRVLRSRSWSFIFINDSSGAGAGVASDLWLLRSPGKNIYGGMVRAFHVDVKEGWSLLGEWLMLKCFMAGWCCFAGEWHFSAFPFNSRLSIRGIW